ncbi:hypothetical protein SAMN02745225_01086 [Ferrithrix thermotolerans DSM 19514]|uniref:Tight adherence protein B n=1 Tax=Ferrithrix thermotolerans DSM 19514 TaxID=1121881 RepID=A0A1M4UTX3_9ACTN|nr:hypothetical protein [Ferrithrix thermotolerans]SHE60040.1 hypothetical protein SAMN02745225_01086 [Ferrithrix thermotolerans DSM 19514]
MTTHLINAAATIMVLSGALTLVKAPSTKDPSTLPSLGPGIGGFTKGTYSMALRRKARESLTTLRRPRSLILMTASALSFLVMPMSVSFAITISSLAVFTSWTDTQKEGLSSKLQELWPQLLHEMSIRVATTGSSLGRCFFNSLGSTPSEFIDTFRQAESIWLLTGDLETAFRHLEKELSDPNSQKVLRRILTYDRSGTQRIHEQIELLRHEQLRRLYASNELKTKLASIAIARYLIVIVPVVMFALGVVMSGTMPNLRTGLSQVVFSLSILTLGGCWFWTSRLSRLPEVKQLQHTTLTASQRVAVALALQVHKKKREKEA